MLQMPGMQGREVLRCLLRAGQFGMALTSDMTELVHSTSSLISGADGKHASSLKLSLQQESEANIGIVPGGNVAAAWSSS